MAEKGWTLCSGQRSTRKNNSMIRETSNKREHEHEELGRWHEEMMKQTEKIVVRVQDEHHVRSFLSFSLKHICHRVSKVFYSSVSLLSVDRALCPGLYKTHCALPFRLSLSLSDSPILNFHSLQLRENQEWGEETVHTGVCLRSARACVCVRYVTVCYFYSSCSKQMRAQGHSDTDGTFWWPPFGLLETILPSQVLKVIESGIKGALCVKFY